MATHAHVGISHQDDAADAGTEAARAALAALPDGRADLAIVYATVDHDQEALLAAIQATLPGAQVIGCSGEGVIANNESVEVFAAVAVMAIASDTLSFQTFLVPGYGDDPAGAGARLADLVNASGPAPQCLCVMSDGLLGNCTGFLDALHQHLSGAVPVVGGTAGDDMAFARTYQYAQGQVVSGGVVAFTITGPADIEIAVSHGCSPVGLERTVTGADGGWLHQIDGQTTWSVFKEYLNDDAVDLNADGIVHLCIGLPLPAEAEHYDPFVIRTPLQLDTASGAMFFPGGGLRTGDRIQLTRRDPERIKESARQCAARVLDSHPEARPAFVLQFDCAGRGRILFGACTAAEIVVPLRETLGASTPWLGFHTYGEIAPIGGRSHYHNYTVALCAVYDHVGA